MNNNFDKDLADGQKGEQAVRHFVETVMEKQFKKYNDNANYDILFQNPYEDPVTFEVKTDYWEKNIDEGGSGNMAIEYKCRGKPSGIRTTKATYFAYYFPNIRDKHLWVITVDNLKKLLRNCVSKRVNGGETYYDSDEKVAKCFLIDRYRYRKHFDVYSWDGRGVDKRMRPKVIQGDVREVLKTLDDESVQCVVTSPPYWGLRDYGVDDQLGLEATPEEFVENMVDVFREVKRVLRNDGTLWLNLGDSYFGGGRGDDSKLRGSHKGQGTYDSIKSSKPDWNKVKGLKPKDLVGIPWRVALALQADGWYLRSDIIWNKPNPMPEPVKDRPTKSHEYIFLLTKSPKYYYDHEAIKEKGSGRIPGNKVPQKGAGMVGFEIRDGLLEAQQKPQDSRNKRSVWKITTKPYKEAHFATFPEELPETCIKAGTQKGDVVLDIFAGSGTTLRVASKLGRKGIGIELNPEYIKILKKRCKIESMSLEAFV